MGPLEQVPGTILQLKLSSRPSRMDIPVRPFHRNSDIRPWTSAMGRTGMSDLLCSVAFIIVPIADLIQQIDGFVTRQEDFR